LPSPIRQSVIAGPLQPQAVAETILKSSAINPARKAVLLLFCDPVPAQCLALADLSSTDWRRLLHWLDISGLALYFLERIHQLNRCDTLPPFVLTRLEQNQTDNTARTISMIAESTRIQRVFQREDVGYAVLKGLSLCPESVQRLELRHQFDLDFLV
jgi:hypothetical protein